MNTGTISRRYAKALLELSKASGRGEQDYHQAIELLEHPEDRPETIEQDLRALTKLLVQNGRVSYARFILRSFIELYRSENGIVDVQLTTAAPSPGLEDRLRESLCERFGGDSVTFSSKTDPELIGGFTLVVDKAQLDASVRSQLEKVRRSLEELNKRIV